ncbi:hypothetical protein BDV98DRAFT_591814 [Pterulicium gracile]|uniref:Thaumatin n=1 Tax=Pterulicium gracile TaxID=1884261 RepID=A0A5C3QR59_9AGAR|nr:hypothetical protein BDV98DRAFT_591814 [Pterula gracilis]
MHFQSSLTLALGALASLVRVAAVHNVTFTNNCETALVPTWSSGLDLRKGASLAPGATAKYVIPETYSMSNFYAQDGSCTEPGGQGCTSFHCTLPPVGPSNECHLKVSNGFNIPLKFQLTDGCDASRTCRDGDCSGSDLDRIVCRVHQFGIELTFCPA